ncbi:mycofactocin biosynthesis glycosyltransferase MftF [Nocardia alni]|uniref:mycofactocin biosynthesis glycosyltransferase MftF n=1 Tax=Nocardia alni TaxID=2815723 RepID=UPI001C238CD7|nr:mycofactocin biosynthesis glycosyltransferase MftF [Nocardia alni]
MSVRVRPDARMRRFHAGRIVLGGAPTRLLRLSPAGAALMESWLAGEPVGDRPGERRLAHRLLRAGVLHPIGGDGATADVTVVVPVKDNPAGVRELMGAIGAEAAHRIVVDDGSAIPVPDATIRHTTARGPAAARNAGYRCARTDLVAFLDSDTTPEPGWLNTVVPLFDDPDVAAVAPRIRARRTGIVGGYESRSSCLDMGPEPANVHPGGRVRYVPTAALVVRRAALDAVGGFDETLRYGEDVDLVWRLVAAGYVVRYQPDSVVWHSPRGTVREWLVQRIAYGSSAAPLARRHPGLLYCAHLSESVAVQAVSSVAGYPILGFAVGVVTGVRTAHRLRGRGLPLRTAAGIAAAGELSAANQIAEAIRRVWWPLALPTRRGRILLAASYIPAVWHAVGQAWGVRWLALRVADDTAYGLGVWLGCLRERSLEPLLPRISRNDGTAR